MKNKVKQILNGEGASTGAVYLIFVRLVTIVLGFAVSRLLSEYLSKYDYGTYSQSMLIVSTVTSLTILGMADAVNFFFCKEYEEVKREQYIATIFCIQYIVGVVVSVILMMGSMSISRYLNNEQLRPLLFIVALLPLFQNLIAMLQVLFLSIGKSKLIAIRNLVCSLIKLIVVYIACVYLKSIKLIVGATVILDIFQTIFFYIILYKNNCKFRLRKVNFLLVKEIFQYSIPMAAFTMINSLSRDMDKYVISILMDTENLAIYTNAAKILPFDIVMASFCTVLLPYITSFIAKGRKKEAAQLYKEFLQLTYITTVTLAIAVLIVSPEAMTILYTEKYLEGLTVFCIYILVDIVKFTNITLVLSAAGKTKKIMIISMVGLGLNFFMNILLFCIVGFSGPAIATLVVTFVMGIFMLYYSAKEMETTLSELFDKKYMIIFAIKSFLTASACGYLRKILISFELHYVIVLFISAGVFVFIMTFMNGKKILEIMKKIEAAKLEK